MTRDDDLHPDDEKRREYLVKLLTLSGLTMAPVSAAQPPTECTTVEPAKSEKPISESQPPPQIQEPWIG